jgi:hypothetical protein
MSLPLHYCFVFLFLYLRIGFCLLLSNIGFTMLDGASFKQALRVVAIRTGIVAAWPLPLQPFCCRLLWLLSFKYTLLVMAGVLPKKNWQELLDS